LKSPSHYTVTFAGQHVTIEYESGEVYEFLSLLFSDLHEEAAIESETLLWISAGEAEDEYVLSGVGGNPFGGCLDVRFAAVVFDAVIYNLLNDNSQGIAFHAGAVAHEGKVILLPGESGFGKSSMTACLLAAGCSYLTDELYFIPLDDSAPRLSFTRPLCIKSGSAEAVRELFSEDLLAAALGDQYGYIIPHRLLNPEFKKISAPPSLILIPKYTADSPLSIEKLSPAQISTLLMTCDVNGRNLEDHGFRQVVRMARATPAYRITYGSFHGVAEAMNTLYKELGWI